MNFRDEMRQKVNSGNAINGATTYREQCVANYHADIQKASNTIINIIKNDFKEARVNPSYFKKTLWFKTEKCKKNAVAFLHIYLKSCAKYENRICLKKDDRGIYYLFADKYAMLMIYQTVMQFCKQNGILNFNAYRDDDYWPCVNYIDKYWTKGSGDDTSGINYHDERPWMMNFYMIMFL